MKKVLLLALIILVVVWIGMFCTDCYRIGNLQEPVFMKKSGVLECDTSCAYDRCEKFVGIGYRAEIKLYNEKISQTEIRMFGRMITAAIE